MTAMRSSCALFIRKDTHRSNKTILGAENRPTAKTRETFSFNSECLGAPNISDVNGVRLLLEVRQSTSLISDATMAPNLSGEAWSTLKSLFHFCHFVTGT